MFFAVSQSRELCREYKKHGACRNGNSCKYSHQPVKRSAYISRSLTQLTMPRVNDNTCPSVSRVFSSASFCSCVFSPLYHLYPPHYKSPTALLDMCHFTCGISSLLHSINLILFTLLLDHLILPLSPPLFLSPVTPSTFHSGLKTHLLHKSFPP